MASPDVNKNKGVTRPFNILEVLVVQVGDGGGERNAWFDIRIFCSFRACLSFFLTPGAGTR